MLKNILEMGFHNEASQFITQQDQMQSNPEGLDQNFTYL